MRLIREVFSFDLSVSNATPPRWLPSSCATHSRTSAERKMRANAIPDKEEKFISNAKSRMLNLGTNDAPFGGICLLTSGVVLVSFLLSRPFCLCPPSLSSSRSSLPPLLLCLSFFFILNTLREEMLPNARSRGEDVPLTAYTNPKLPQQPGELFPFRFPISLQLALSKRVRAAAPFVKAVLRFPALISGTMSGA